MMETSARAWLLMSGLVGIASLAGLLLSRLVPWAAAVRQTGVPRAFGLAMAPFLAGFCILSSMAVSPGARHGVHLAGTFLLLLFVVLALGLPLFFRRRHAAGAVFEAATEPVPWGKWDLAFAAVLGLWVAGILGESLFIPLMDNDALEYATVGRLLFELRDLSAYPALDPSAGSSGFFGPWTHPPLYVALIYLSHLAQGHADAPGMMRLISPWFAFSAASLVYALGRINGRPGGLAASLILLSTPLFYVSVSTAQIDALPVAAMTLLFCSVVAIDASPTRKGMIQGLVLGAALWTHSEAVLFIPLALAGAVFFEADRKDSGLPKQIAVLLSVACLAAAWPYAKNWELFDSFISDNPAVFALKKLEWAEYFRISRGLDSWWDKIQYGLFKGWFAAESFALSFWFMTLAAALFLGSGLRRRSRPFWTLAAFGCILCYLGGIVLSLLAKSDLMIRNGRYLLVLLPCVALLGGAAVQEIGGRSSGRARWFAASIVLIFCVQFLGIGTLSWRRYGVGFGDLMSPAEKKQEKLAPYNVVKYLRLHTPPEAVVLSLQPANMYYANRRMISYLDPRLIPFYKEEDIDRAWDFLRDLGVRYVHARERSFPPLYNSSLERILAREDLAKLVFSEKGYQLYEMRRADLRAAESARDLSPEAAPWTLTCETAIGGEKGLLRFPASSREAGRDDDGLCPPALPFLRRNVAATLTSPPAGGSASVRGDSEYRLDLVLEGKEGNAFAQVYLTQFNAEGRPIEGSLIGETALNASTPKKAFQRRFKTDPLARAVGISVSHRGDSALRVGRAEIVPMPADTQ